jgi:hypothetical protein
MVDVHPVHTAKERLTMSSAMYGEPLLKGGSAQAARGFVDAFRATLGDAASDAAALRAVVQRNPSADPARAVEASRHMLEGAAALRATADSAVNYTQRVPDVGNALDAAECVLTALDSLLDGVESLIEVQYGIAPVCITPVKVELPHEEEESCENDQMENRTSNMAYSTPSSRPQNNDTSVFTAQTFTPISALRRHHIPANQANVDFSESPPRRPKNLDTGVFSAQAFTPNSAAQHRLFPADGGKIDYASSPAELPSTPSFQEFGIDGSALEGLKAAVSYRPLSAFKQDRHWSQLDEAVGS